MIKHLSIDEAKQKIDQGDVILVDVRDINSYERAHIEGAEHLTADNFGEFCDHTEKDMTVIVYCYHGNSSQVVVDHLVGEGFVDIYSMDGGFEAWRQKYNTISEYNKNN